jgi:hypothetical protein
MNEIFNSNPFIHSIDKRLNYINEQEQYKISLYGSKYIEYIEELYYDNNELYHETTYINEENYNISIDELINIVLTMDMNITIDNMKYIDGIIYDLDLIEYWNNENIINKIKIYQLLSVIKNTFGINDLNQLLNVPLSLSQSLFTKKYKLSCYIHYNNEINKITSIGLLYNDKDEFMDMMKDDLKLEIENIIYIQQLILIDRKNKIKEKLCNDYDYIIIGIYRGELSNKNENYWRLYNYEIFNDYFLGQIYNTNIDSIEYNKLKNKKNIINEDNNIIIRNNKRNILRKRLSIKRRRKV